MFFGDENLNIFKYVRCYEIPNDWFEPGLNNGLDYNYLNIFKSLHSPGQNPSPTYFRSNERKCVASPQNEALILLIFNELFFLKK